MGKLIMDADQLLDMLKRFAKAGHVSKREFAYSEIDFEALKDLDHLLETLQARGKIRLNGDGIAIL